MPKQYLVFKTSGRKVYYETGDGWTENRGRAVRFSLKHAAETYMNRYVKQTGNSHYGVVDAEVNTQVLKTLSDVVPVNHQRVRDSGLKSNPKKRKKKVIKKNPDKAFSYDGKGPHVIFLFNEKRLSYVGRLKDGNYYIATKKADAYEMPMLKAQNIGRNIRKPKWAKSFGVMKASNPAKFARGIQKITYDDPFTGK